MPKPRSILPFLLIPLLFSGCSCQQTPANGDTVEADPSRQTSAAETSPPPSRPESTEPAANTSRHLSDAAALVQAYLNAMVAHDTGKADAFWSGGKPPPNPGDDLLRTRDNPFLAVRIMNDVPLPVDSQSPPQLLEVPVRLRIETAQGLQRIRGSYRLRFRPAQEPATEGRWEIISASLQPELR